MRLHGEEDRMRTPSKTAVQAMALDTSFVSTVRPASSKKEQASNKTTASPHLPPPAYRSTRSLASISASSQSSSKRSSDFTAVIGSQIEHFRLESPSATTKVPIHQVITVSDSDDTDSLTDSDVESYSPLSTDHFSGSASTVQSNATSLASSRSPPNSPQKQREVNAISRNVGPSSNPGKATPAPTSVDSAKTSAKALQKATRASESAYTHFCLPARQLDRCSQPKPTPRQPAPILIPQPPNAAPASPDEAISAFLQQPLGTELEPCIVAHDTRVQNLFDDLHIEWGVQYQLARGQSNGLWTWHDVVAKAEKFKGTNEEVGPNVATIMMGAQAGSGTDPKVWTEIDREQAAILENQGRMIGLMGEWKGEPNWHGGQIQQLARLVEKGGNLKVLLEPLEMRRSHRFARFAGSRRILQLRIPNSLLQSIPDKLKAFLGKRFILMGRTFVPFHCKDGSVYMVETNQDWERKPQEWCGDQYRHTFIEFMEWHNPMALNARQAISKFVTRYALGLSNSIPAIEFARENIVFIDDIYASDWPEGKPKAPTEKIMTDGCGYINLAALTQITRRMGYESAPTALQGRIDGAKGLWIRHPTDDSEGPKIWIRDSQNKIKNPRLDRAHRIFELVAPSKASTNVALSMQSILNLYYNNVPEEVLVELFRQGLKDEIHPLLKWDSMVLLYDAVSKAGGVSGARLVRVSAGASVALGLQRNQWGHDDVDSQEDEDKEELEPLTYTGRNQYSGAPHGLHECLLELIQAGFHPRESKIVQDKLQQVIKTAVTSAVEKYRISLKDSISAWMVPDPFAEIPIAANGGLGNGSKIRDPLGLLKEGEVYFKSSQPLKDQNSELAYHVITGDVVLGRYPMRLPSDLQKATAVDIAEYALYTDVLIVSVNGTSSLPSFLSGGDMDGDIVNIFRDPEIVRHFTSQPLTEPPGDLLEANFEKDVVSVQSFCSRAAEVSPADGQRWFQEFLLGNVVSAQKGLYSMFHDSAVATLGYSHPRTIRLAYIFNALLDASKTGLRLKEGIFEKDKESHGKKPEPFGILARLRAEGVTIEEELMVTFKEAINAVPVERDPSIFKDQDLLSVYSDAIELIHDYSALGEKHGVIASFLSAELKLIREHVDAAKVLFDKEFGKKMREDNNRILFQSPSKGGKVKKAGSKGTTKNDQDDLMLQATKKYSEPIENLQIYKSNVEELKASYAYYMAQSPTSRFPWTLGFRGLCTIKAKARGIAPVIREIDECKNVSSSVVKVLSKNSDAIVF